MADQKQGLRQSEAEQGGERAVATSYTGTAAWNRAADIMKERDSAGMSGTNSGGFSASEVRTRTVREPAGWWNATMQEAGPVRPIEPRPAGEES